MPAIVDYPKVFKQALEGFGPLSANEPERRYLAEYFTGLIVAHKKNVSAINRQFAVTTDQSCLNHWLTEVQWDQQTLHQRRLDWLQDRPVWRSWGTPSARLLPGFTNQSNWITGTTNNSRFTWP